jgi:TPR repeat protein
LYANGQGVRQDYVKAREWYEQAAAQGNASAQRNLGLLYANGLGVRQSWHQAVEYYGKSCDLGLQLGCDFYREHKGTTTAK